MRKILDSISTSLIQDALLASLNPRRARVRPMSAENLEPLADQRKYYDEFWKNRPDSLNVYEIERLAQIYRGIRLVAEHSKRRKFSICDLGCGTGWLSHDLAKFGSVTGVDLSPDGIELAKKRWPGVHFEAQDILRWRPEKRFDLVVSSEVIEHVDDQAGLVDTVSAILEPNGYLILTSPNARVRRWWDMSESGGQMLENWLTTRAVANLLRQEFDVLWHETFILDYFYCGIFRVLSAPKLLKLLAMLRLLGIYNAIRTELDLGLYQICVAQKSR